MKHRRELNTFYVKTFSSEDTTEKFFHLDQTEELAKETLEHLNKIPNIEKIINLDSIIAYPDSKKDDIATTTYDESIYYQHTM